MKRFAMFFCLFLVIALLFCFGGCKKAPAKTAKELIASGEYQKAYDLLLSLKNPTEEEKELLGGFFFQEEERTAASGFHKVTCTYDENGRLIARHTQLTSYQWNNEVFTYDDKGNMLTRDNKDRDGRWEKTVWTYDDKGNVLTEEYTSPIYDDYKYTYTYDADGKMLTMRRHIDDATNSSTAKGWHNFDYTYDEKGNLVKEVYTHDYPFAMQRWHTAVYTHDERGNVLTETTYYPSGELFHAYTYTYDEKNNLLTEDSPQGQRATYEYTYDNSGNMCSQTHTADGYRTTTLWEYDEMGRLISKVSTLADGTESYREQYTYDDNSNRITHYKKESNEEVSYSSKWKLFYNPELAALPAEERTCPEPEFYLGT